MKLTENEMLIPESDMVKSLDTVAVEDAVMVQMIEADCVEVRRKVEVNDGGRVRDGV